MAPNQFPRFDSPTADNFIGLVGGAANVWQPADVALARPNNATAYATGNALGSSVSAVFKFTSFFRSKQSSGLLTGARLIASVAGIATSNMGAIRAHVFNALPTGAPAADQGTFNTLNADDAAKLGTVDFSTWTIGGASSDLIESYGTPALAPMPLIATAGARDLYVALAATGAFTPAALQSMQLYLAAILD